MSSFYCYTFTKETLIIYLNFIEKKKNIYLTIRVCLVETIWEDLFLKNMDLSWWRLFGWPNLGGWIRRDLQDEILFMWRDLKGCEGMKFEITK